MLFSRSKFEGRIPSQQQFFIQYPDGTSVPLVTRKAIYSIPDDADELLQELQDYGPGAKLVIGPYGKFPDIKFNYADTHSLKCTTKMPAQDNKSASRRSRPTQYPLHLILLFR